jgi:hypothetical protein
VPRWSWVARVVMRVTGRAPEMPPPSPSPGSRGREREAVHSYFLPLSQGRKREAVHSYFLLLSQGRKREAAHSYFLPLSQGRTRSGPFLLPPLSQGRKREAVHSYFLPLSQGEDGGGGVRKNASQTQNFAFADTKNCLGAPPSSVANLPFGSDSVKPLESMVLKYCLSVMLATSAWITSCSTMPRPENL